MGSDEASAMITEQEIIERCNFSITEAQMDKQVEVENG